MVKKARTSLHKAKTLQRKKSEKAAKKQQESREIAFFSRL
jgi:hypothetical protein